MKEQLEEIAISECFRGHENLIIYIAMKNTVGRTEEIAKLKNLKNEEIVKTQIKDFQLFVVA